MAYSPSRNTHRFLQSVNTTDATVTPIKTIPVKNHSVVSIIMNINAIRTGGASGTADDAFGGRYTVTCANKAGTATIIGSQTTLSQSADQGTWAVTSTVSGGLLTINVAGAAANNITWNAELEVNENL